MSRRHLPTSFPHRLLAPSATAFSKRSTRVQIFSLINILNCLPPLLALYLHEINHVDLIVTKLQDKNSLKWPVGSGHSRLGLQIYFFIKKVSTLTTGMEGGLGGGGGAATKPQDKNSLNWPVGSARGFAPWTANILFIISEKAERIDYWDGRRVGGGGGVRE